MLINDFFAFGTFLYIVGFIIVVWRYRTINEERKQELQKKMYQEKTTFELRNIYLKELEKRKEPRLIIFSIFAVLTWTMFNLLAKGETTFPWVAILLAIVTLIMAIDLFKPFLLFGKKYRENLKELNKSPSKYPATSFDNFIAGRMPLAKMFWLYFMFIGIILSVISGYFFGLAYPIVLIIPVAYCALISVALWNCATLYTNEKLAQRQSYGWAIGVKIVVVLNIIVTLSQIGLMLSGK